MSAKDLREHGTAGSFFKNPILTVAQFEKLTATYGAVPSFPTPDGVKIPLAYLLDKILGLRGYRMEKVWLFGNQPLVLVADTGASARNVEALAQFIEKKVLETFEISLEREVRTLEAHETK